MTAVQEVPAVRRIGGPGDGGRRSAAFRPAAMAANGGGGGTGGIGGAGRVGAAELAVSWDHWVRPGESSAADGGGGAGGTGYDAASDPTRFPERPVEWRPRGNGLQLFGNAGIQADVVATVQP